MSFLSILFWFIFVPIVIIVILAAIIADNAVGKENEFKRQFEGIPKFDPIYFYRSTWGGTSIAMDTTNKKFALAKEGMGRKIYKYDDLIAVDARRNGTSVHKTNRGSQAAGAAVGGVLFGPAGFIVGGLSSSKRAEQKTTELSLRLIVNNEHNHYHEIVFFKSASGLESNDPLIQKASSNLDGWHGRLQMILHNRGS